MTRHVGCMTRHPPSPSSGDLDDRHHDHHRPGPDQPDRHLHPRPRAHPDRVRHPARDGDEGPRLVRRVRGHRRPHRRSNDFLAMDDYPEITFVSTGARQVDDTTFELTGDLTIKGVTNSITIPFTFEGAARDPFGNTRVGFEGSVTISRKDYGITWNAALETGGVLVGDKVVLEFEVSAIKNA